LTLSGGVGRHAVLDRRPVWVGGLLLLTVAVLLAGLAAADHPGSGKSLA
jgi:hypothetical protein